MIKIPRYKLYHWESRCEIAGLNPRTRPIFTVSRHYSIESPQRARAILYSKLLTVPERPT